MEEKGRSNEHAWLQASELEHTMEAQGNLTGVQVKYPRHRAVGMEFGSLCRKRVEVRAQPCGDSCDHFKTPGYCAVPGV